MTDAIVPNGWLFPFGGSIGFCCRPPPDVSPAILTIHNPEKEKTNEYQS